MIKNLLAAIIFIVVLPVKTEAVINVTDDFELEGFFKIQNMLRTPRFRDTEFIMQRNTAQLEGKYYFLKNGKAFKKFSTGPIEEATFTFIGRAVYDSVYDTRDSFDEPRNPEFTLREAFVDLVLPPFTLRLGRQQVVWGETDNFRALDVINPLDVGWHWSRESWEDIRIPLWMARGIYDIGKIGPFEESFLELVWIPADFRRNKTEGDPNRPWGFTGAGLNKVANSVEIDGTLYNLDVNIRDRGPRRKLNHGQGGARFKALWGDLDFSLNYFYGYSGDSGYKTRSFTNDGLNWAYSTVDMVNPRSHVFGLTANYSEEVYTMAVIRLEATLTTGVPVSISDGAPLSVDSNGDNFDTVKRSVVMLGLDRPTWIRSLNSSRTFFISTQLFWRRYINYSSYFQGIPRVYPAIVGGKESSTRFLSTNTDQIDRDEFVFTFSASTSYGAAGLFKPLFVVAYDPISTGGYTQIAFDYLWTDHIVFRVEQHYYWGGSGDDPGPWQLGDIWGSTDQSRHETLLSIIFQF